MNASASSLRWSALCSLNSHSHQICPHSVNVCIVHPEEHTRWSCIFFSHQRKNHTSWGCSHAADGCEFRSIFSVGKLFRTSRVAFCTVLLAPQCVWFFAISPSKHDHTWIHLDLLAFPDVPADLKVFYRPLFRLEYFRADLGHVINNFAFLWLLIFDFVLNWLHLTLIAFFWFLFLPDFFLEHRREHPTQNSK